MSELHLTLDEAFDILWKAHLKGKPSWESYRANRKALSKSFSGLHLDCITPFLFREHRRKRLAGEFPFRRVGLGSVFHDHGLLRLLYSKLTEWKRDNLAPCDINLSELILPAYFPTDGSKRKRPPKRRMVFTPSDFLKLCQNATSRLRRTIEGLLDLDIRESDLKALRPSSYNPYTDQVEWVQNKTGKENFVPVTERVRQHFIEARANGREFVYDLTNSRKEFEEARRLASIPYLTKRDLRKTTYNAALRFSGSHQSAGMYAGHASTRTGIDHYEIEFREDLKPIVKHMELVYRSS